MLTPCFKWTIIKPLERRFPLWILVEIETFYSKRENFQRIGFLHNRFIGESTRLVYDIMAHVEEYQPGLLMLIDFEEAFDSVLWRFIYKTSSTSARIFKPGSKFWIAELQQQSNNPASTQPSFPISRGCWQGDQIASYWFLLCDQILYLLIMQNKDIKGIDINQYEHKLTEFADNTTLIIDGSQNSQQASLNTLGLFRD